MQHSRTWRDLLGEIIKNPQDRLQIAHALGINPVTLTRWVTGPARPRASSLSKLVKAVPQEHRQEFEELLSAEFPDTSDEETQSDDEPTPEIPSAFYARVNNAFSTVSRAIRSTSIFTLILQQMLAHLDPEQEGLSISIIRCTRPIAGQPVRSLIETMGRGTPPFKGFQEPQPFLLGAESLAGAAVMNFRPLIEQNLRTESLVQSLRTDWEESAMACPLLFEGGSAGCSLIASTRLNFFTPIRQRLVEAYTNLMILALHTEDFIEQSRIQLQFMPSFQQQQPYFQNIRRRVAEIVGSERNAHLTSLLAQEIAYQEIEAHIIQDRQS